MAKITLEPGDRIAFPAEQPGYTGVGIIISETTAFLIEIGSRSGPKMYIGSIPGGVKLLQESIKFEAKVALDAIEIVLNYLGNENVQKS